MSILPSGVEVQHVECRTARRGAESSNTPPATRHLAPQALQTGGEDTAVFSLGIAWGEAFEGVMEALKAGRDSAEANSDLFAVHFGGTRFAIHPGGSSSGGGRGQYYAYRLEACGLIFKLSKQEQPKGETPNVLVTVGSSALFELGGVEGAFQRAKTLLESMGGEVTFDKVSRVDVCADLPDEDVEELVGLLLSRHSVCRARKRNYHQEGDRWTGFTVGSGDCLIRVYDKAYEVAVSKPDAQKRELLERFRWGRPCEKAVRVEFQLRREALKAHCIDTVAEYLERRGALLRYLVTEWFRLAAVPVDRENRHQDRPALHPMWERITAAFEAWGTFRGEAKKRVPASLPDVSRLGRQVVGCLMSAQAQLLGRGWQGIIEETDEFTCSALGLLRTWLLQMGEDKYFDAYALKLLRSSVRCAAEVGP